MGVSKVTNNSKGPFLIDRHMANSLLLSTLFQIAPFFDSLYLLNTVCATIQKIKDIADAIKLIATSYVNPQPQVPYHFIIFLRKYLLTTKLGSRDSRY